MGRVRTTTGYPGDQSLLLPCSTTVPQPEHSASDKINDPARPQLHCAHCWGQDQSWGGGHSVKKGQQAQPLHHTPCSDHPLFLLLHAGTDPSPPTLPGQEGQDHTSLLRPPS